MIHFLVLLGMPASSLLFPPKDCATETPDPCVWIAWPYTGLCFFGGCSSLSLVVFFNFSPVPHPFSVAAWAVCLWLQVKEAVKHALSVGYRHIDCAAAYSNEAEIGDAFQECVGPNKVKAQELPCWLCVVPKLTAVPWEGNSYGFSCCSTPAVCYLSGEGMKEGFLSSESPPGCNGEERLSGIFGWNVQKMPVVVVVDFFLFPLQSIPVWLLWGSQNQ